MGVNSLREIVEHPSVAVAILVIRRGHASRPDESTVWRGPLAGLRVDEVALVGKGFSMRMETAEELNRAAARIFGRSGSGSDRTPPAFAGSYDLPVIDRLHITADGCFDKAMFS
jgi:hypothetical protein